MCLKTQKNKTKSCDIKHICKSQQTQKKTCDINAKKRVHFQSQASSPSWAQCWAGKAGIAGAGGVAIKVPLVIEGAGTIATVGEVNEGLARLARRMSNSSILLLSPLALVLPLDFAMQPFVDLPGILSTISKKLDSSTWQGTASGQVMVSRHASGHTRRP